MPTLSLDDARQMSGSTLTSTDGTKIGKVSDVYIDNDTQKPEWALVHTGLFGGRESFVPLAEASMVGGGVTVPYSKDQVKDAPNAEPDGELSQEEEGRLYAHYGLNYSESASDSGLPTGGVPATGRQRETPVARETVGRDTSGRTTDDAMTRSEERLQVGVQKRPSQTVRLKKYIVTENVTTTVPLAKERAVVTREPITDANRAASMDGPEITEAVHEVSLHEERAVVNKETVPVERVRLDKNTVTEQQTVNETVRKEQIEVLDDVDPSSGTRR